MASASCVASLTIRQSPTYSLTEQGTKMTRLTRKQREIAERHQLILDVARKALIDGGYLGLNMDRIADATDYSKGTIYQHFTSKEDLLGALTVETMKKRAAMFERAVGFNGRPRERLMAIGIGDELFFKLHPDHFLTEQITRLASISDKISTDRRASLEQLEVACFERVHRVVGDAIAAGDLLRPEGMPDCTVLFGLRSMAVGAHTLERHAADIPFLDGADLSGVLWENYNRLLDGYGWKPLSTDWDYKATEKRILMEVFNEEYLRLTAA